MVASWDWRAVIWSASSLIAEFTSDAGACVAWSDVDWAKRA